MKWLEIDFYEPIEDGVRVPLTGIELVCKVPGLVYQASVPGALAPFLYPSLGRFWQPCRPSGFCSCQPTLDLRN